MAKKEDGPKLDWQDVAEDTIKGAAKKALDDLREARKVVKEKQAKFEEAFLAEARKGKKLPDGKTLRFSYNFGRIGVAVTDDTGPKGDKKEAFKL